MNFLLSLFVKIISYLSLYFCSIHTHMSYTKITWPLWSSLWFFADFRLLGHYRWSTFGWIWLPIDSLHYRLQIQATIAICQSLHSFIVSNTRVVGGPSPAVVATDQIVMPWWSPPVLTSVPVRIVVGNLLIFSRRELLLLNSVDGQYLFRSPRPHR